MTPDLCLGTAQFGLDYGVTNAAGQVTASAVAEILAEAAEIGIRWLDTAQAYGNAEAVLGDHLPASHSFQLINKLPAQPQPELTAQDVETWEKAFHDSCQRLRLDALDSLLLHAPADLSKPGGNHLETWLLSLRHRGLVRRLGVSIYGADDL